MEESLEDTISRVWDEFEEYWKSLEDESDRGVAILAMSRLELILDKAFASLVPPDTKSPLRSTEAKLYVGLVAGLYDKKVFDGLKAINGIRNRFAHQPEVKDFCFNDVRSSCGFLKNCIPDGYIIRRLFESRDRSGEVSGVHKRSFQMYFKYCKKRRQGIGLSGILRVFFDRKSSQAYVPQNYWDLPWDL